MKYKYNQKLPAKVEDTPQTSWKSRLEPFVQKWEAQGRSENEKWAVRNFLTGQGGIGIAFMEAQTREESYRRGANEAVDYFIEKLKFDIDSGIIREARALYREGNNGKKK
jgi:hypothetical protein